MKTLSTNLLRLITIAILYVITTIILGLVIPILISITVSLLSSITLNDCINNEPFLGFSILLTIVSAFIVGAFIADQDIEL